MRVFRSKRRNIAILTVLALVALALLQADIYLIGENPLRYHVDPVKVESLDEGNQYLLAPSAMSRSAPNRESPVFPGTPEEVMMAFDDIVRSEPRVTKAAGGMSEFWITYMQRSRILGFPDYISVVAIGLPDNRATIAVFSRSVYGSNDLGVNEDRVVDWITKLEKKLGGIE